MGPRIHRLALIAVSALVRTGGLIGALLADLPALKPYGRFGLGVTAGYLLASVAVIAARRACGPAPAAQRTPAAPAHRRAGDRRSRGVRRVMADAPLYGENGIVHEQALGMLDGACCFSHRPLGYPMVLAGAYALLGEGPGTIETLNLLFAAVTTWLVWDIGRVSWGRSVAAVAATAYAVAPSQVLMVLLPLTEPMYTMLVAGAVRAGIALGRRQMLVAGVACAAFLAAGQYVRATAVSLLIPVALLPWLVGWPLGRTLRRAALIGGLLVVLSCCPSWPTTCACTATSRSRPPPMVGGASTSARIVSPAGSGTRGCGPPCRIPWGDVVGSKPIRGQPGAGSHPGGPGRLARAAADASLSCCGRASRMPPRTPRGRSHHPRCPCGLAGDSALLTLLAVLAARRHVGRPARPAPGRAADRHVRLRSSPLRTWRSRCTVATTPTSCRCSACWPQRASRRSIAGGADVDPRSWRADGGVRKFPLGGYCGRRSPWRNCPHANCCHR